MTWFLDLRALRVGGPPAREVTVRESANNRYDFRAIRDLVKAVRGKDVLLGTHGFNVNRQQGIDSLENWGNLLALGDSALFVGILWAGDSRWVPVLDYPFEGNEAIASAHLLAPFLDEYFTEAISLSFASHSLGARLVLETIHYLRRTVKRLTLMAGAIEDNCLNKEYKEAAAKVNEISVLASRRDDVLKLAFPLANPVADIISRGHPYWQGALGYDGPDTPYPTNVRAGWQIPDQWGYGHGDYLGGVPPALAPPVNIPQPNSPLLSSKPAWSAGFVSTRFSQLATVLKIHR
ncbi:MAG: alpha/beta hydrolase [Methylobacter sp.]|nr:alpha/beta hydrolase [Methylobacter sp.]